MSLVRDLERNLERLVDAVAGWVARGPLHPVELASRIVREADLSLEEGRAGHTAPNHFVVRVGADLPAEAASWEAELEAALEETAAERGWRLEGPARVSIRTEDGLGVARVEVSGEVVAGARSPWASIVTEGGTNHAVSYNRALIGRSTDNDIVIADKHVSRNHALLYREAASTWIVDQGSANGTFVNAQNASAPVLVDVGDVIALGPVTLRLM